MSSSSTIALAETSGLDVARAVAARDNYRTALDDKPGSSQHRQDTHQELVLAIAELEDQLAALPY